uniref:Uncharacterized protein n=1 Tax=Leersia perrieri TaxID=77586 RepID=A0A0D9W449_9ORYZ
MFPGHATSKKHTSEWFQLFYIGLNDDNEVWYAYGDLVKDFENPSDISLITPFESDTSAKNFLACICPSLLPSGIASGRKTARQLGFGQLPPRLTLTEQIKSREAVTSGLHYNRILNIAIPPLAQINTIELKSSSSAAWDNF